MFPALAAGVALINATIVSDNQTQRDRRFRWLVLVLGFRRLRRWRASMLNGQGVHIRMQFVRKILAESFPTVIGNEECEAEQINPLIVRWIYPNLAEIEWARIEIAGAFPGFAPILRTKDTAAFTVNIGEIVCPTFVTLHHCHHDLGIRHCYRETDFSD